MASTGMNGLRMVQWVVAMKVLLASASMVLAEKPVHDGKLKVMPREEAALGVTLTTDRSTYAPNDQITMQILLTNRTNTPVYIYSLLDWGESASVSVWARDAATGKDIVPKRIADAVSPPPSSKGSFVGLRPEHVYGVVLIAKLSDLGVEKAGTYELVAEYHSPVSADMGFGLAIWGREKGTLESNVVTIRVESGAR